MAYKVEGIRKQSEEGDAAEPEPVNESTDLAGNHDAEIVFKTLDPTDATLVIE